MSRLPGTRMLQWTWMRPCYNPKFFFAGGLAWSSPEISIGLATGVAAPATQVLKKKEIQYFFVKPKAYS